MAKIKLTKTAVESAQPQAKDVELRDTVVPGFLCKITPTGRRVFMLQYRTNSGQPRKPSLGLYGELAVPQEHAKLDGSVGNSYLQSVSSTIGGGTSEVQRNIIATRGLGLPRG